MQDKSGHRFAIIIRSRNGAVLRLIRSTAELLLHSEGREGLQGAFSHSARTVRAQRAHGANYYGDYPGNNPENHPPAESCTINSKLKNSNI